MSTIGDVQDLDGASMIPHSSRPMPTMDRAAPDGIGTLAHGILRIGHDTELPR